LEGSCEYSSNLFQRYIWFKKSLPYWNVPLPATADVDHHESGTNTSKFPVEVDYLVQDTLEPLRPKLHFVSSLEEAANSVAEVEKEVFAKLGEISNWDWCNGHFIYLLLKNSC